MRVVVSDIRNLADEEVMQLVGDGNPRAFELLYDRHGGASFSLAYRMVGNRVTAEDITQEAFLSEERHEARERTEVEAARNEEARSVRTALDSLPAEQRRTIELAYFGGFSQSQIAEMLDEPVGTVKGRTRLGLDKLRRQLSEGYVAGGLA